MNLHLDIERWPLRAPFRITSYTSDDVAVLLVTLTKGGHRGWGEAAGVYYHGEDPANMCAQLEAVRSQIEAGVTRDAVRSLLPPGGARNALDCALWDLEAKLTGAPAWTRAGIAPPCPLQVSFTCGAETPEVMAQTALAYVHARAIKIKLTGEPIDADRVRAVREARPEVWLGVDANQGFTREFLDVLLPTLVAARVSLIEQPFPIGQEGWLDGLRSPIRIAADESAQGLADLPALVGRFDVVNIKLDKCGGLTEALAMASMARQLGLGAMVGNMLGTSLAMAPGFVLGQLCEVVDLDAPVLLRDDRAHPAIYTDGYIQCPPALWGYPTSD